MTTEVLVRRPNTQINTASLPTRESQIKLVDIQRRFAREIEILGQQDQTEDKKGTLQLFFRYIRGRGLTYEQIGNAFNLSPEKVMAEVDLARNPQRLPEWKTFFKALKPSQHIPGQIALVEVEELRKKRLLSKEELRKIIGKSNVQISKYINYLIRQGKIESQATPPNKLPGKEEFERISPQSLSALYNVTGHYVYLVTKDFVTKYPAYFEIVVRERNIYYAKKEGRKLLDDYFLPKPWLTRLKVSDLLKHYHTTPAMLTTRIKRVNAFSAGLIIDNKGAHYVDFTEEGLALLDKEFTKPEIEEGFQLVDVASLAREKDTSPNKVRHYIRRIRRDNPDEFSKGGKTGKFITATEHGIRMLRLKMGLPEQHVCQ